MSAALAQLQGQRHRRAMFQTHGLTPKVEDTDVVHDEEVSTIIQRETDIRFLKRLAAATDSNAMSKASPAISVSLT